jgi:hypothetical protein
MPHARDELTDTVPQLTKEEQRLDNEEQIRMAWAALIATAALALGCVYMMFKPM